MIERLIQSVINKYSNQGKIIIIYGARQVGKTTLLKSLIKETDKNSLFLNCDDPPIVDTLTNISLAELKLLTHNKEYIFIDEAQRIKNIGLTMEAIVTTLSIMGRST